MIWFAMHVTCGRETFAERVLRSYFRECRFAVEVSVPVRHVVRHSASTVTKRAVRSKPTLPGIVFLGVRDAKDLPIAQLERFRFLHGFMPGEGGAPLIFSDADMVRILGELHQRPLRYRPGVRVRKQGDWLEIADGPYALRTARILSSPDGKEVTSMIITGTTKEFDGLKFDNDRNQPYSAMQGRPSAIAAQAGSQGGPAEIDQRQRGQCVLKSTTR